VSHNSASAPKSYASGWDRVHQVLWEADVARGAELDARLARERQERQATEAVRECVICDRPVGTGRGGRKLCRACRLAGWTGMVCDCGRPLHQRDKSSSTRRCGRCRRAHLLENGNNALVQAKEGG
jgi:ribosomal protein S14